VTRALAALALACGGCGLLQTPESALAATKHDLEEHPPALDLGGGGALQLTELRIDPPRLQPMEGGSVQVICALWAEGRLGKARLVFHGPDELRLVRPSIFAAWRLDPELPRLRSVARALLERSPPSPVAVWQVGVDGPAEAEVREEYQKDAAGRPLRAASRLTLSLK
jgi:hypothetical protein